MLQQHKHDIICKPFICRVGVQNQTSIRTYHSGAPRHRQATPRAHTYRWTCWRHTTSQVNRQVHWNKHGCELCSSSISRMHSIPPAGVLTQGGGAFGTFVSSFYLQFSRDGRQWYTYKELITDARPRAKVRHHTQKLHIVILNNLFLAFNWCITILSQGFLW